MLFIAGCTAREYKLSGDLFVKTGEYEKAVEQYQKWADLEEDKPEPYVSLSVPYYKKSNYMKSAEYLKDAFERDKDLAKEAVLFYENFLEVENYSWYIFYNGAKDFLDEQQLGKAKGLIKEAEEIDDSSYKAKSYVLHGRACIMEGEEAEAIDYLDKATNLDKNNAEAYIYLGMIYSNQSKIDEAIFSLKKALSKDPDNFLAHKLLGQNYLNLGKYDKAIEVFEKASSISDNDATILYLLSSAYLQKEDYTRAAELAEKILALNLGNSSADAEAFIILGISNLNREEYSDAIEALNKAIEADSNNCDSYQLLSHAYNKTGKINLSKEFAKKWEKCVEK